MKNSSNNHRVSVCTLQLKCYGRAMNTQNNQKVPQVGLMYVNISMEFNAKYTWDDNLMLGVLARVGPPLHLQQKKVLGVFTLVSQMAVVSWAKYRLNIVAHFSSVFIINMK
jgi:hypothetical protein